MSNTNEAKIAEAREWLDNMPYTGFSVTLEHDGLTVRTSHAYEYTALERFADLMLWCAVAGTEHYVLMLTKGQRTVSQIER